MERRGATGRKKLNRRGERRLVVLANGRRKDWLNCCDAVANRRLDMTLLQGLDDALMARLVGVFVNGAVKGGENCCRLEQEKENKCRRGCRPEWQAITAQACSFQRHDGYLYSHFAACQGALLSFQQFAVWRRVVAQIRSPKAEAPKEGRSPDLPPHANLTSFPI